MLLCLELDDSKAKSPRIDIELIGSSFSFHHGKAEAPLPQANRDELASDLEIILSKGTLGPAEAARYRGELGFFQTLMFGRAGWALIQPFTERQYASTATTRSKLSPPLRDVAPWRIATVGSTVCRCTEYRRTVVVYTDASGAGRLGFVLLIDGKRWSIHTHCPECLLRPNSGISEIELVAECLGLTLECLLAPGRPVLLFCDNRGAAATVVRGSCKTVFGRLVSSAFWAVAARFRSAVWVGSVASKLNVADDPSRDFPLIPLESRCVGSVDSPRIPDLFIQSA